MPTTVPGHRGFAQAITDHQLKSYDARWADDELGGINANGFCLSFWLIPVAPGTVFSLSEQVVDTFPTPAIQIALEADNTLTASVIAYSGSSASVDSDPVSLNAGWNHVVVCWGWTTPVGNSKLSLFINGELADSETIYGLSVQAVTSPEVAVMGRGTVDGDTDQARGTIDELYIWSRQPSNRALFASALYQAGVGTYLHVSSTQYAGGSPRAAGGAVARKVRAARAVALRPPVAHVGAGARLTARAATGSTTSARLALQLLIRRAATAPRAAASSTAGTSTVSARSVAAALAHHTRFALASIRARAVALADSRTSAAVIARATVPARLTAVGRRLATTAARCEAVAIARAARSVRHAAYTRTGWTVVAVNADTRAETVLGFVAADLAGAPVTLADVAIPDGDYYVEARPADLLWEDCRQARAVSLTTAAGTVLYAGVPAILNLRAEVLDLQRVVRWEIPVPAGDPTFGFGLWFGATSPVFTGGDPDDTISAWADQADYLYAFAQAEPLYIAVAAVAADGTAGPPSELYLAWGTVPLATPANQLATIP